MAVAGYKALLQLGPTTYNTVGFVKSVDLKIGADIYDISDLSGTQWKKKLGGMADYSIKISAYFDLTDAQQTTLQTAMITNPGATVTWKLLPTGVGNPAYGGTGILKSMDLKFDVKSEQQVSWDMEGSGPLTYA